MSFSYPFGMSRETWLELDQSGELEAVVQLLKNHTKVELAIRCRNYINGRKCEE